METFTRILSEFGAAGLDIFWLPIGIWTLIALVAVGFLTVFENKISGVYQYHSRVALLWSLAAGVAGSALFYFLPLGSAGGASVNAKFIVIQNPVTITASTPEAAVNWADPFLWAGIITALTAIAAIVGLLKLGLNFVRLNLFSKNLDQSDREVRAELTQANRRLLKRSRATLSFSYEVAVPCTFGWAHKQIVLPQEFKTEPEKLNMALLHELTHIANNDYLINTTVQAVKALFFFHPLVHRLAARIEEYREISCDRQVLQDTAVSHKHYAELLFELSPKTVFKPQPAAVSMAVHPSTLKKRIQTMMTSNHKIPSMKWSISLMFALTLLLGGLMACSDIQQGGITSSEVDHAQAKIEDLSDKKKPLLIINGEVFDNEGIGNIGDRKVKFAKNSIMTRIKVKYIESMHVWKGQKAIDKYGQKGRNGAIELILIDKEKAMNDLYTDAELEERRKELQQPADPEKEVYLAADKKPEMIGGIKAFYDELYYPRECKKAQAQGKVILQFVVSKQGKVQNTEVIRGIGNGCDEAAINAITAVEFKPGMQDGKAVNMRLTLPVIFKLDGAEKKPVTHSDYQYSPKSMNMDEVTVVAYLPNPEEDKKLEIPPVSDSGTLER